MTKIASSVFKSASPLLLSIIKKNNESGKITFLLPTKYVSTESAKVGMLLNNYINNYHKKKRTYRTFFASSHFEALNGTIKIIRENHLLQTKQSKGIILIFDPSDKWKLLFNPLEREDKKALVPGLLIINSWNQVNSILNNLENDLIGFICGYEDHQNLEEIDQLFKQCKNRGIYSALDEGHCENWYHSRPSYLFSNPPDIFLHGENLVNYELPFGSFSMSSKLYKPWNSINSCLTHSSSYSGNTLTLSMILALFEKHKQVKGIDKKFSSRKQKYSYYGRYVNPKISIIFHATGLSPEVEFAKQSTLTVKNQKGYQEEILDCVAGSGCCLRGHNPENLIQDVIQTHDIYYDYWKDLSKKLTELTGMPHIFPAVSGSTSVDIGIILSLLANSNRTRMITFKHNYSGKSLISLNLTRSDPYRLPFSPLYFDVLEIDPFEPKEIEKLEEELLSGNVGIVWFEIMQGQGLDFIPQSVLNLIQEHKEKGGYLIGIDEILTGMFRTGNLLCSQDKIKNPDIITLAKGTTDMTFPMACVLVSAQAYLTALTTNSSLVKNLETYFINQLGSHIFLNALNLSIHQNLDAHVKKMGEIFKKELEPYVHTSHFLSEIKGEGLLIYLKLNKKIFPINALGEDLVEFLMSQHYLKKGKILFLNSRLTPPLTVSEAEVREMCRRIKQTWDNTNPFLLFLHFIKQVAVIYSLCFVDNLKKWIFKT